MDEKEIESLKKTIEKEGFVIIGKKEYPEETILYLKKKERN